MAEIVSNRNPSIPAEGVTRAPAEGTVDKQPAKDYEVSKETTASGVTYEVGRPKGSKAAEDDGEPDSHGPQFSLPVNWVPANNGWKYTDSTFQARTGISRWKIEIGGTFYHYRIWFKTDQTYNYTFMDEAGQGYGCDVWLTSRDHYVDYNSNMPNIVRVSGE